VCYRELLDHGNNDLLLVDGNAWADSTRHSFADARRLAPFSANWPGHEKLDVAQDVSCVSGDVARAVQYRMGLLAVPLDRLANLIAASVHS